MKGVTFLTTFLVALTLTNAQTCPTGWQPVCGVAQSYSMETSQFPGGLQMTLMLSETPDAGLIYLEQWSGLQIQSIAKGINTPPGTYTVANAVVQGSQNACPLWSYPVDQNGDITSETVNGMSVGCSAHPYIIAAFSMSLASLLYVVVSISYKLYVYYRARRVKSDVALVEVA